MADRQSPQATLGSRLMRQEKRTVAGNSVIAALVSLKIVVGLSTHSLGIPSKAAHSALDQIGNPEPVTDNRRWRKQLTGLRLLLSVRLLLTMRVTVSHHES